MVSAKLANRARDVFSDELFRQGIHGLAVDKVMLGGKSTFALIAMVPPGHKGGLPETLDLDEDGKHTAVPVVVRTTAPFKPG